MQKLYTLYDCKSETYAAPILHRARGEALRAFSDGINSPGHTLNKYPEDFTLFEIGEWDDQTGEIKLYDARVTVANAIDLKIEELPLKSEAA
jgi:hypothetical protein